MNLQRDVGVCRKDLSHVLQSSLEHVEETEDLGTDLRMRPQDCRPLVQARALPNDLIGQRADEHAQDREEDLDDARTDG